MGTIKRHPSVKLFVGFIFLDEAALAKAVLFLQRRFGTIDSRSPVFSFTHTRYYENEFGTGLKKQFISFRKLIDIEQLPAVKRMTNALETRSGREGSRRVNIDPGYLTLSKVVLATTKDYAHRIYISGGIFAEVTLYYRGKTFTPYEWTYPDFRTDEYMDFFNRLRNLYAVQAG